MRFTVVSIPNAQDELVLIWLQAPDKNAVTRAADTIDKILQFSPTIHGFDPGKSYSLFVEPLTAIFIVSPDDCLVTILQY